MLKKFLAMTLLVTAAFAETAYFKVEDPTHASFVIQLNDDAKIAHARNLISGATTDEPHILGRIIKQSKPYNPGYSFILDPNSINFFNIAIEVCDAHFHYLEDHLDEACGAFLPGCVYCPWSSRIVQELEF